MVYRQPIINPPIWYSASLTSITKAHGQPVVAQPMDFTYLPA
jgi:hypothetical protein